MVALFAGSEEYEGLLAEDRAAILDAATTAIGNHAYAGVGIVRNRSEATRRARMNTNLGNS